MSEAFHEDAYHGHDHSEPIMQLNPAWVVTFIRWTNRSLGGKTELQYQRDNGTPDDFFKIEPLLIVDRDCISVSVNNSKSSITPAAQVVLKSGSYDYLTAVAPGDFMFINMVDSENEAKEIASLARNGEAINKYHHGFKGVFRVKTVRKVLAVDKKTGLKVQNCIVQGYAFSELNNTVYFNPHLINRSDLKNDFLFLSNLSDEWRSIIADKEGNNVQKMVAELFRLFVGVGLSQKNKTVKGNPSLLKTPTTHFFIPGYVGKLLGERNAVAVKDIYNLLFGIQSYVAGKNTSPQTGFNPANFISGDQKMPRLKTPSNKANFCQGRGYVQAEYWQQVTAYSIMQQYLNSPINELYSCFRVDTDGYVMPTLVMRQIPFSTDEYTSGVATKFLNLPRWAVPKEYLYEMNLGREDAARFNFVQVFGRLNTSADPDSDMSNQTARGNYSSDKADILKNGLRSYVITSNFDMTAGQSKNEYMSITWAKLLADSLIGGHLKMNGTITVPGIAKPIAVGDNLQIDKMVFHIEGVTHSCSINPDGEKTFLTTVELSNGVLDLKEAKSKNKYINMTNTNSEDAEKSDNNFFGISTTSDGFGVDKLQNTSFSPQKLEEAKKAQQKNTSKKPQNKKTNLLSRTKK